jgi:hypothetical protein
MPNRAKWEAERRALKKVQVHFSFTAYATRRLKYEAVEEDMTPSNLVRKLVGLSFEPRPRQRIGLSLTDEDFKILSTRYGVAESDKVEIKRRVTEEINLYYHDKNKAEG